MNKLFGSRNLFKNMLEMIILKLNLENFGSNRNTKREFVVARIFA